jgi:hypothetical protein
VEDKSSDLAAELLGVVPVQTHERAAVNRDVVGQNAAVVAAASSKRNWTFLAALRRLPALVGIPIAFDRRTRLLGLGIALETKKAGPLAGLLAEPSA